MQETSTLINEMGKGGRRKVKVCFVCRCGIKICGNSIDNAKANLEIHRKSLLHRKQMEGNLILKKGGVE